MAKKVLAVRDLPPSARPRERLKALPSSSLLDEELLAILLGTGSVGEDVLALSRRVLHSVRLDSFHSLSLADWRAFRGINDAKASLLVAAFELATRASARFHHGPPIISSPRAVVDQLSDIRTKKREYLVALYLNARHQMIHREIIGIGILTGALVHPREVFAPALSHACSGVIVAHNHPSGSLEPSDEDIAVTHTLEEAGKILQLQLLDHIIVTTNSFCSLKEKGHMS